jgi:hypothetical protein
MSRVRTSGMAIVILHPLPSTKSGDLPNLLVLVHPEAVI